MDSKTMTYIDIYIYKIIWNHITLIKRPCDINEQTTHSGKLSNI